MKGLRVLSVLVAGLVPLSGLTEQTTVRSFQKEVDKIEGSFAASQRGAPLLSVNQFLERVERSNVGFQGARLEGEGAALRSRESGLLTKPQLFSKFQYAEDRKPPTVGSYDVAKRTEAEVGIKENFTFGLSATLAYNVAHTSIDNYANPFASSQGERGDWTYYNEVVPRLELALPLWGNGFGRGIRAQAAAIEAGAQAQSHFSKFQAQTTLAQAEVTYWRLSLSREIRQVQKEALERGKRILEWKDRQAKVHLADKSDSLQAKAAYELRYLDYQIAAEEERSASLAFNLARGVDSPVVRETLEEVNEETLLRFNPPRRDGRDREDVRGAEFQAKAAQADNRINLEKSKPTLDVYGAYSLYGQAQPFQDANTDAFGPGRDNRVRDSRVLGVKFSIPIDYFSALKSQDGREKESIAADLNYQQKARDQENQWEDLLRRFADARARLKLISSLEKTQEAKLSRERTRLEAGRSTVFQILSFEQDYAQAQLLRIKTEAEAVGAMTQMKLFTVERQ